MAYETQLSDLEQQIFINKEEYEANLEKLGLT